MKRTLHYASFIAQWAVAAALVWHFWPWVVMGVFSFWPLAGVICFCLVLADKS